MDKSPSRRNLLIAVFLSLCVGMASGIVLQKLHVPALARRAVRSCLPRPGSPAVDPDRPAVSLRTRTFAYASDPTTYDTERDSTYVYHSRPLDLRRTALVLIDVWAHNPNEGFQERSQAHMRRTIAPLLALARRHHMVIIHSHNREEVAPEAKPLPGEFVVDPEDLTDDTLEIDRYLRARGITALLYAGYASNVCVLLRPTGMVAMKKLGYEIVLIRDCTLANETPESLDGEWNQKALVNMVETSFGSTTTLGDIREAFGERP